jgi:hypothetical protein
MFAGAKAEGGKEVVTQAKGIPPYCLDVELMASGEQYLVLTKQVTWEAFHNYAEAVVSLLGGTIVSRADSPVERVWSATIQGSLFSISFDGFALGVSLCPQNADAGRLIPGIRDTLRNLSKA